MLLPGLRGDDDARPRGEEDLLPYPLEGADQDVEVRPPARDVSQASRVAPPGNGLQGPYGLHHHALGGPGDGSPGEEGGEDPAQGGVGAGLHLGDQVRHVGVPLHGEKLPHPHGAGKGHPGEVVAHQVHQHGVFGPLLGGGKELLLQEEVLLLGSPPWPGAGDGPGEEPPAHFFEEPLRASRDHGPPLPLQKAHEGCTSSTPLRKASRGKSETKGCAGMGGRGWGLGLKGMEGLSTSLPERRVKPSG